MGIFSRKTKHTSAAPANNAQAASFTASIHDMQVQELIRPFHDAALCLHGLYKCMITSVLMLYG